MKRLQKPEFTSSDLFITCISQIVDESLKTRLINSISDIVAAEVEYDLKAKDSTLFSISRNSLVAGIITNDEMTKIYNSRMVRKNSPGRIYYDQLLSKPEYGRCPLCGQRIVSTIDHYLPKSSFPSLTLSPYNLIPSCKDCNSKKLDYYPTSSDNETIHPYYDDIDSDFWLFCEVIEELPATFRFFVSPPSIWTTTLQNRVQFHFDFFNLADLYTSYAAEELFNIKYMLHGLFSENGRLGVKNLLESESISRSINNKNSWQSAMYRSISENEWFCNGGFE